MEKTRKLISFSKWFALLEKADLGIIVSLAIEDVHDLKLLVTEVNYLFVPF